MILIKNKMNERVEALKRECYSKTIKKHPISPLLIHDKLGINVISFIPTNNQLRTFK